MVAEGPPRRVTGPDPWDCPATLTGFTGRRRSRARPDVDNYPRRSGPPCPSSPWATGSWPWPPPPRWIRPCRGAGSRSWPTASRSAAALNTRWWIAPWPERSAAALAQRVGQVRELGAAWVILTLGARELADPAAEAPAIRADVEGLVAELRKGRKARPEVLLVGLVPPSLDQAEGSNPEEQQAIDARTEAWNRSLGELASGNDAVTLVDPWADWPRDPATRGALTVGGFSLSDQGQARVAAAVCDVLLASAR